MRRQSQDQKLQSSSDILDNLCKQLKNKLDELDLGLIQFTDMYLQLTILALQLHQTNPLGIIKNKERVRAQVDLIGQSIRAFRKSVYLGSYNANLKLRIKQLQDLLQELQTDLKEVKPDAQKR